MDARDRHGETTESNVGTDATNGPSGCVTEAGHGAASGPITGFAIVEVAEGGTDRAGSVDSSGS